MKLNAALNAYPPRNALPAFHIEAADMASRVEALFDGFRPFTPPLSATAIADGRQAARRCEMPSILFTQASSIPNVMSSSNRGNVGNTAEKEACGELRRLRIMIKPAMMCWLLKPAHWWPHGFSGAANESANVYNEAADTIDNQSTLEHFLALLWWWGR